MPGIESRAPERTATSSGILRVAEFGAHDLLHVRNALFHLRLERRRIGPLVVVEIGADFGA